MVIAKLEQMLLARDLIQAKLRLSIVAALTGVTQEPLRKMWKELHGERSPNGKLPESALSFVNNVQMVSNLSAIVLLHQKLHKTKELTPTTLLATWNTHVALLGPIDINAAYYVLRDVRSNMLTVMQCSRCEVSYIYDRELSLTSRCPYCKGE
ncbi:flagellar transcriptional regulator FlhC [Acidovorax sp. LjRoot129]|uniref:FlhC family transcriptional regulator n=1 Tax=Acidovorax sp. LjRoot194 TaxID=3342280 RepID=UPI003ECD8C06